MDFSDGTIEIFLLPVAFQKPHNSHIQILSTSTHELPQWLIFIEIVPAISESLKESQIINNKANTSQKKD